MQYLDNFLHLPDLIPLDPPEDRMPLDRHRDEDEVYQELKDRRLEDGREEAFSGSHATGTV